MFNVIHLYFVLICFRSLFSPRFIANETIFFYIFSDFSFFPFLSFSNFHSWFSFFLRNIISILILKKYNHSKWTVVCFNLASILIDWLISWLVSIWQMGRVGKLHFQFRSNFFVVDIIFLVWDVTVTLITHTHQLIILKVIYQIRCDDQWKCLTSMYLFFPFFKVHVFWLIDWLICRQWFQNHSVSNPINQCYDKRLNIQNCNVLCFPTCTCARQLIQHCFWCLTSF